jgi:hypothetical protein
VVKQLQNILTLIVQECTRLGDSSAHGVSCTVDALPLEVGRSTDIKVPLNNLDQQQIENRLYPPLIPLGQRPPQRLMHVKYIYDLCSLLSHILNYLISL